VFCVSLLPAANDLLPSVARRRAPNKIGVTIGCILNYDSVHRFIGRCAKTAVLRGPKKAIWHRRKSGVYPMA
jgi:hypothetical protein